MQQEHTNTPTASSNHRALSRKQPANTAYVRIVEQPASKAVRFRYECEKHFSGTLLGQNSTPNLKTYPTIEIVGFKGRSIVVVSCVTKNAPYRPHPHNLIGNENCKKGVCCVEIDPDTMCTAFKDLSIQCVKKRDIEQSLRVRQNLRVDPFRTGFAHSTDRSGHNPYCVRLCFQVFLANEIRHYTIPLPPVVSEPIYNKRYVPDLNIVCICSCSASVLGNTNIILICEKIVSNDIAVRFFEEKAYTTLWEAYGTFDPTKDIYKRRAIAFRTPSYRTTDITEPVQVYIELQRPSDGATSDPIKFEFLPVELGTGELKRKRPKLNIETLPNLQVFQCAAQFADQMTSDVESTAQLSQPQYPQACVQTQQQQQQQQIPQPLYDNNEPSPTATELLDLDSGQLIQLNSEDQYLLQLTTEELRHPNISL